MDDPDTGHEMVDSLRRGRPAAGQDPVKRKQIIEGGRRVFLRMGFDAASMNDITREAGVSKGTIYVYFANKEELFEAIIEEERSAIFEDLYRSLENGGSLREMLVAFGIALTRKITSPKVMMAQRTVIGVVERNPELGARFYERGPKLGHDKVATFLEKAVAHGLLAIDDIDLAAYQAADLMLSSLFRPRLFGYRSDHVSHQEIERVARSGVDVFLKAYGTAKLNEMEKPRH